MSGRVLGGACALVIAALLGLSLSAAGAAGCDRWTGAMSESWSTAANWTAGVPTANTAVCISGSAHDPNVTVARHVVAGSLSVGAKATLTIAAKARLSVSQTAQVAGALALGATNSVVRATSLSVAHTGALSGVGSVHGSVDNAGSVTVVDGASGVPLRISGHYRQRPSGTILFRDEGGSFTQLRAGSASLGGGLELLILDALVPGTKYKVVSATALNGKFARVVPGYVVRYNGAVATVVVTSQIKLSKTSVVPGEHLTVSGAGFGDLGTVDLHLDGPNGAVLGSSYITSVGTFDATATIPGHISHGHHAIVAVESPHGYTARAAFTVS